MKIPFNKVKFSDFDTKLLDIEPNTYDRNKTAQHLHDYTLKEMKRSENYTTDWFYQPNTLPRQSLIAVSYKNQAYYFISILIEYGTFIPQFAVKIGAKSLYKHLQRLFNKRFGKPIQHKNIKYWKDNDIVTFISLKTEDKDRQSIEIKRFDSKIMPIDTVLAFS